MIFRFSMVDNLEDSFILSKQPDDINASIVPELTVFKFTLEQKSSIFLYGPVLFLISQMCFAALSPTPLIAHKP